ncbi:MAG TPA: ATP-binding protein [Thermodesulfobacteriota bacterium]|nr:ATP-binding protein [Thermodesulfobacteriota bacterium]
MRLILIVQGTLLLSALLINLGFGFLVYRKAGAYKRVNLAFSFLSWSGAGWGFSILMEYVLKQPASILFWGRMSFATSAFIPSVFLIFTLLFPREQRNINPSHFIFLGLPAVFFSILSFTDQIVISLGQGPKMFNYGWLHPFFTIYLVSYIFIGFLVLMQSYRRSIGIDRLQIKYCLLGMFFSSSFGVIANLLLPMAGISTFNWLGPPFTMIMLGFTAYSIVKHRLMDINIVLKKGTTYTLLLLLLFVPSFLLILLGQKLFFLKISYLFTLIIVALLFLVTIVFNRIRPQTEKMVEQVLFKNRYDYRETLGNFSKALVSILDLQSLSGRILETITQTMGVEKASLFLWNEEKAGYTLSESKNVSMNASSPPIPKEDPLPRYLQKIGGIIIRDELAKGANKPPLMDIASKMSLLEAQVTIPFISKGQLVGMMNLGYKFSKDIYSHEDIELLSTLANQTAIAIENARLYEDLKRSKSYIRRADRLASLGTLTAGLAHEIRNPMVAIKTLTQLLPERLEDEEFRNQFLKIASGEVDRISSLVNELLDFARPSDPKWALEDINAILEGMILLVSTGTKKKLITIVKNYARNLPLVEIDREQIKQVVLNILLNAIDATAENGTITVQTRSFIKPGGEPYIQIEFTDTGCGIPGEHLEDIFNPFFTTKATGSGLGLSISNQIIQDHKGYIDVESEIEKGSSFFINLPVHQNYPKRRTLDSQNTKIASTPLEER